MKNKKIDICKKIKELKIETVLHAVWELWNWTCLGTCAETAQVRKWQKMLDEMEDEIVRYKDKGCK